MAAAASAELPRFTPSADTGADDSANFAADNVEEEAAEEDLGGGVASFYATQFNGRPTASGEAFDSTEMTAAHRTLPFGSMVRVTNADNGQSVVVRINDRGPFHGNRTIDVSRAAAERLDIVRAGHGRVKLALVAAS